MLALVLTSADRNENLTAVCDFFLERRFEVGVVLAGPQSDVILRDHKKLAECDLVYDINEPFNEMTKFQSGLYLANNPCMVVTSDGIIDKAAVNELMRFSQTTLNYHLIRTSNQNYPVLVTRKGIKHVRGLDPLLSLADPRILVGVVSQELINAHNLSSQPNIEASDDLTFTDLQKSL